MYKHDLDLPDTIVRVFKDTTASAAPVGNFYYGVYHTLVVAPATSNTVAKCVVGISDNLATNVFAQAGKCRVPTIVFACDTAPELETRAPKGMVMVYPRRIDLENTDRLESLRGDARSSKASPRCKKPWRRRRTRGDRSQCLSACCSSPGVWRFRASSRMVASFGEEARDWRIHDIGVKVAALMTQEIIARRLAAPGRGRSRHSAGPLPRRSRFAERGVRRPVRARAGGDRRSPRLSRPRAARRPISRATTCASSPRSSTPRR